MISIITSIHNQLAANKLFFQSLKKNTKSPFELIVIDNSSKDGSSEYFEKQENAIVYRTDGNYNYPYCQNKGIELSRFKILCFFNNDLILSPGWDQRMLKLLDSKPDLKVLSFASNEYLETRNAKKKISRRWKRIKFPIQYLFGNKMFSLKSMLFLMYGNFDKFAEKRYRQWGYQLTEGMSGSAIAMKREAIKQIGMWDERIQAADFDLFNRVKKYSNTHHDFLPVQVALGIYFHHFLRLTSKSAYPAFSNKNQMISLEEKWGEETKELRKDIFSGKITK